MVHGLVLAYILVTGIFMLLAACIWKTSDSLNAGIKVFLFLLAFWAAYIVIRLT